MSPVEFLSALVAPATTPPAASGDAGDAAAFERAVAAVAAAAGAARGEGGKAAPKKLGFLHGGKFMQAGAPLVDPAPADPALAVATAVGADATAAAKTSARPAGPVEEGEQAAAPEIDPAASPVAAPTTAAPQADPAAEAADHDVADEDEGTAAVERTLGALLDRILVETGAAKDTPGAAERLEAAQEAIGRVLDQAPPHVRPKLEALLARMSAAAGAAQAASTPEPVVEDDEVAAEEPNFAEAEGEGGAVDTPATRLAGVAHDLTHKATLRSATPEARPAATSVPAEEPAPTKDAVAETAAKPSGGFEPSAPTGAKPEAGKAQAPAPAEPAAPASPSELPPDVTASADTAAGAPAAHAGAQATVAAAVRGSPETVAHLSAEILKKLEGRSTRFDMELHPADLGRVDVRLTIEADGRLNAQLAFDNPVAAADLRARADELRRSLEQAGFQVSEDSFSFAERGGDGRSFEDTRQQFADGGRARARAFRAGGETADLADAPPVARRAVRLGVDVRI